MGYGECEHGWQQIWWSGPAKLILHPEEPRTIEAVSKKLRDTDYPEGRICPFCWESCLRKLEEQAIVAADNFFNKIITDGVAYIKTEFFMPHTWFEEESVSDEN